MRLPLSGSPRRTLGPGVALWITENCAVPDGESAGEPFIPSAEQLRFLEWFYAVDDQGQFLYRRGQLVRPQKWGKGPLSAAIICAEAAGPVLFDYFDEDGDPVGKRWPTPWVQVVAVSEDQTDNVWTALVPMIELGPLKADVPDTGKTRINVAGAHGSSGVIEPVTSAAISRLGQRITFAVHDETHSWTQHNGGTKLADTQRRNLAGMGGRSLETTNAWDPAESSVAQVTAETDLPDVLVDYPEPPRGSIRNKRERRQVLRAVYAGAPWVNLDRVDAEIEELLPRDPGQAERFFLNRIVAGSDKAFDLEVFEALTEPGGIDEGRLVTLGFDGSLTQDATGLVAADIERGYLHVVALWERPLDLHPDDEWQVPIDELNEAVEYAFGRWDVWRLYGDPPHYREDLARWAGQYGADKVLEWWTNRRKQMAYALKAFRTDMRPGVMSHDGHEALIRHVGNSVKRPTNIRDEDDGSFLWLIGKDGAKSPRKIDLAMCAVLAWEARADAIRAGVLDRKNYARASW